MLSSKISIESVDVKDKRVLIRVDFNVPLDKKTGQITDDTRIRYALNPSGCSVLCSIAFALNRDVKLCNLFFFTDAESTGIIKYSVEDRQRVRILPACWHLL
jgi:hypothetical protein